MQIAIIGAGIGGLAAGLACQQAGIGFELFDGAERPLEGGVALTLWPNALLALQEIGALEQGRDWMHFIQHGSLRTDTNRNLLHLPLTWMQTTYGFQPICLARRELTTRLYEALGRPTIHKAHCHKVVPTGGRVTVQFLDRPAEDFDAAIAADGIHSAVRYQLAGDSKRPVNYTAWRGIAVNAHVNGASMCEYVGPGLRFGYATMSASLTYWFATVNNHLLPPDPHVLWSQVAERFSGFPEPVSSCILHTPFHHVLQSPVADVRPGIPMAMHNVALLGDAAHAITPNLGLGACLALEDAKALARVLMSRESLSHAFARYAQNRRLRVAAIARFTRCLGQALQLEHPFLISSRNALIRQAPDAISHRVWKAVLGER